MTYGRFTLDQWEKRGGDPKEGGNPYLEADGRWHRITDFHVVQGLGIVTYQAEECDSREVEAWLREHMEPVAEIPVPQIGAVETVEGARAEVQYAVDQRAEAEKGIEAELLAHPERYGPKPGERVYTFDELKERLLPDGEPVYTTPPLAPPVEDFAQPKPPLDGPPRLTLVNFAKTRGWKVGRISNEIRRQYREEYPD